MELHLHRRIKWQTTNLMKKVLIFERMQEKKKKTLRSQNTKQNSRKDNLHIESEWLTNQTGVLVMLFCC